MALATDDGVIAGGAVLLALLGAGAALLRDGGRRVITLPSIGGGASVDPSEETDPRVVAPGETEPTVPDGTHGVTDPSEETDPRVVAPGETEPTVPDGAHDVGGSTDSGSFSGGVGGVVDDVGQAIPGASIGRSIADRWS